MPIISILKNPKPNLKNPKVLKLIFVDRLTGNTGNTYLWYNYRLFSLFSYRRLIQWVLEQSPCYTATLNQIYERIENTFPYYKTTDTIWKVSIITFCFLLYFDVRSSAILFKFFWVRFGSYLFCLLTSFFSVFLHLIFIRARVVQKKVRSALNSALKGNWRSALNSAFRFLEYWGSIQRSVQRSVKSVAQRSIERSLQRKSRAQLSGQKKVSAAQLNGAQSCYGFMIKKGFQINSSEDRKERNRPQKDRCSELRT